MQVQEAGHRQDWCPGPLRSLWTPGKRLTKQAVKWLVGSAAGVGGFLQIKPHAKLKSNWNVKQLGF